MTNSSGADPLVFLSPAGRGGDPARKRWGGEGEPVLHLIDLLPLTLPSFAWAPPSPHWGEGNPHCFI